MCETIVSFLILRTAVSVCWCINNVASLKYADAKDFFHKRDVFVAAFGVVYKLRADSLSVTVFLKASNVSCRF